MKTKKSIKVTAGAAAIALGLALAGPASPAHAVNTGARYCSYGYDAYTAGGLDSGQQSLTLIHHQTSGGVSKMSGLYTQAGQTRLWSAGWQSFSSSSISSGVDIYYTGCF